MREYPQAISERRVVVAPGRRWPDWINRITPRDLARAGRRAEVIERRARQAQAQERAWAAIPDPRWHRGRR